MQHIYAGDRKGPPLQISQISKATTNQKTSVICQIKHQLIIADSCGQDGIYGGMIFV